MVEEMSSCSLAINSGFARAVLRASALRAGKKENRSGDTQIQKRRILASGTFFAARPEPRLVDPVLEPGVACFHGTFPRRVIGLFERSLLGRSGVKFRQKVCLIHGSALDDLDVAPACSCSARREGEGILGLYRPCQLRAERVHFFPTCLKFRDELCHWCYRYF